MSRGARRIAWILFALFLTGCELVSRVDLSRIDAGESQEGGE